MKKNKLFQLIFCLFLWGCSTSNYKQHEDLSSPLKNLIYKCVRDSSNTFSIDKNIGFEWKKLYIFMPYTSTNEIYQKLGYCVQISKNKNLEKFKFEKFISRKFSVTKSKILKELIISRLFFSRFGQQFGRTTTSL